jgi:hypothetical protein
VGGWLDQWDRPLLEHWDGASWSLTDPGIPEGGAAIQDVEVVDDHDIWAILWVFHGGAVPIHYDGTNWVDAPGPSLNRSLVAVDAAPGGQLWAVGAAFPGRYQEPLAERLCPSRLSASGATPDVVLIPLGIALAWTVPAGDTSSYRLTDGTGLGLFDSGPLEQTDTFTQRFAAAATYVVAESGTGTHQTCGCGRRPCPGRVPSPGPSR